MTRSRSFGLALAAAAMIAIVLVACGQGNDTQDERPADFRMERFAELANYGFSADYEPFRSPADALQRADLVAVGRFTRLQGEAIQIREFGRDFKYAVFSFEVIKVISSVGDSPNSGDTISIVLPMAGVAEITDFSTDLPVASALLMLDELSDWNPRGELEGFPEGASYTPFSDGIWFRGSTGDALGVRAQLGELESRWGPIASFDALVEMLDAAGAAVAR